MELTRYGTSCVGLPGTGPSLGMGRLHAMRWSSVTVSAILSEVESRGLPRRVACTMPKITGKASKSSKGGRRSGRKSGATGSSAPGAAQQGASSHSHRPEAVAGGTSPQTSVASLSLEQLMDAVGARVRQELRSQATTPYLSLEDGTGVSAVALSA